MGILNNRAIIITGATNGMGKAMAICFAKEGASLVLNGRNKVNGEHLLKEIKKIQPNCCIVYGDVGKPEINLELVETAINKFGKIDTIIANAGELGLGDVVNLSINTWNQTIATNLNSLFYLAKYSIPYMLQNKFGIFVANASIAAFKAFPNHPAYCASKAGQVALIRQLAAEYGPIIRANAMCPGPIDTNLIHESALAFENPQEAVNNAANATLLNRLGTPKEVADLALFLISEKSSFITGASLNIDGGITVG